MSYAPDLPPDHAITLEQYRRLNLTRPYTDDAIGGSAGHRIRRQQSAQASLAVTPTPDPWERDTRNPDTAMQAVQDRDRESRLRREAKRRTETQHPKDAA